MDVRNERKGRGQEEDVKETERWKRKRKMWRKIGDRGEEDMREREGWDGRWGIGERKM